MQSRPETIQSEKGHNPSWKVESSFEKFILEHGMLDEGISELSKLHKRSRQQMSSRGMLIKGESRSGKTTLFRKYMMSFPHVTQKDIDTEQISVSSLSSRQLEIVRYATLRRVVHIELQVRPTRKSIAADIFKALTGTEPHDRKNTRELIEDIIHFSTEMGTELLLVDEAHHMINDSRDESTEVLSEFCKSLHNLVPFQIAYAGLTKLTEMEKYEQLNERLLPPFMLTPYDWTTTRGRTEFRALLGRFDLLLRLPEKSDLASHEMAKRMYVASLGAVGKVSKYLSAALVRAHTLRLKKINLPLLAEVFDAYAPSGAIQQIDEKIDFDAPDRCEDDGVLRRAKAEKNPFLCCDEQLREIWLSAVKARANYERRSSSRETRLKAEGAKPPKPFGS